MLLLSLLDQPMMLLVWLVAILVVLTIHEFSHALASTLLGDSTAKDNGRLTLNPLAHVSWLGFFMLLIVGFGWGKPVPFNPYNLKYPRLGPALIALAGPFSNLILALSILGVFKLIFPGLNPLFLMVGTPIDNLLAAFFSLLIFLNIILMLFNLIPLPPLDGSKILLAALNGPKFDKIRDFLEEQGPFLLLLLIVFDNILHANILGGVFEFVLGFVYKLFG